LKVFKEKEMPEFRKLILALAIIALFAGFASAQVGTPSAPVTGGNGFANCSTTNGAVTPTLRAEGYTELAGDIVIVCTGGAPLALGSVIPTANITIFLNTAVTSRLLQATTVGNASEALLLIDEPGSGLTGYGPTVPQTVCATPGVGAGNGGCTEWVGQTTIPAGGTTTSGVPVSSSPNTITTGTVVVNGVTFNCSAASPCYSATSLNPGANVFQGVVSGNAVTFFGIPVMPPSTVGDSRVFRITNIRANANGVTAGGPTPGSVVASISASGSSSLVITNSTLTVGFVQQGLSTGGTLLKNGSNSGNASGSGTGFNQCSSASTANLGILQFQENFGTAFKTRLSAGVVNQNIPGTIYNSESGFVVPGITSGTGSTANGQVYTAGQADYATRLKATFTNIPSGVTLFVSTRDVQNNFLTPVGATQAVLVVSEGAIDVGGVVPASTQTGSFTSGTNNVPIAPVPISNGTGTAVWEIINTNPAQIDTVAFAVYINYSASPATNSPAAPSTISVTMSFAPTPSGGLFTSTSGAAASAGLTIPRFSDSLDITKSLASFSLCTTALLYPYVINVNGFDTGLAIANTTTDPFGTTAQAGTCTLYFYGSTAPAAAFVTPTIATASVYANLASTLAPGFSGYMIAACNFQLAHGFAFVSDVGARNLAMGYLALVLTRSGTSPEALNN
jgi:hypothetical protein